MQNQQEKHELETQDASETQPQAGVSFNHNMNLPPCFDYALTWQARVSNKSHNWECEMFLTQMRINEATMRILSYAKALPMQRWTTQQQLICCSRLPYTYSLSSIKFSFSLTCFQ